MAQKFTNQQMDILTNVAFRKIKEKRDLEMSPILKEIEEEVSTIKRPFDLLMDTYSKKAMELKRKEDEIKNVAKNQGIDLFDGYSFSETNYKNKAEKQIRNWVRRKKGLNDQLDEKQIKEQIMEKILLSTISDNNKIIEQIVNEF